MAGDTENPKASVSILVCTHNRARSLERLLQSIARERTPELALDVLVVDNACTDETTAVVEKAKDSLPELRMIRESQLGLSHARNAGAQAAKFDFLLYLDDDAVLRSGYLAALADILDMHQPDLFGGPVYPVFEAPPPSWFDPKLEVREHAKTSGFSTAATISGPNFGIRRAVLGRIGSFATELGMAGERMAFGEDREMVERYRALTPAAEQRLYYALELGVDHEAPARKLTRAYQLKRAYETAFWRERVFIRCGVRSRARSRLYAAAHVLLSPVLAVREGAAAATLPRALFLAQRHFWVVAGRAAGAFSAPRPHARAVAARRVVQSSETQRQS